jgi:mannosylglycerate hydrolase
VPRRVDVVAHTHWDREWLAPFPASRLALAAMLDELLPRLDHPFLLDGQVAPIDDYLDVRPEAAALVEKRVSDGLLAVGPWYVQPDQFQVSGETLLRTLELGLARAEDLGGSLAVGYLPDAFGHIAQLPQLLRLAGIEHAVVWRGVPAAAVPGGTTAFRWVGPDGSSVRAEWLPVGYGNGALLPDDPARLVARLRAHVAELAAFGEGPLLLMHGTDQSVPDPHLGAVVTRVNERQNDLELRVTSLADHLTAAAFTDAALPVWTGELRSSWRAPVLAGVLSNRVDLKQAAARAERALERQAEPLAALFLPAERWPARALELAWLEVIRNAAHDSISGCSVDAVGAAVLHRYAEAEQAATAIADDALAALARSLSDVGPFVVNPSARARGGLVTVTGLDEDAAPSRSEHSVTGADLSLLLQQPVTTLRVQGDSIEMLVIPGRRAERTSEQLRRELFAIAGAEPARTFSVTIERRAVRTEVVRVDAVPGFGWAPCTPAEVRPVAVGRRTLDNGLTTVAVDDDGSLVVDGHAGIDRLVDEGDDGDTYDAAPDGELVATPVAVAVADWSPDPLVGILEVTRTYQWRDGSSVAVKTTVELRAGERLVRLRTSFVNTVAGHRLRTWFALPSPATESHAECAFAVVTRGMTAEAGPTEAALPTFPSRRFVSAGGLTVVHEGLLEYELVEGGTALAVTLVRSVGLLSRADNPTRPVAAGPALELDGPHMLGPVEARYAVQLGAVDPYAMVDDAFVPLEVVDAPGGGPRPSVGSALVVSGAEVSAVRRAGDDIEVRVFNPSNDASMAEVGGLAVDLRPWQIETVRLA